MAVAAWRGMKKGQPGVPGELNNSISGFTDNSIFGFPGRLNLNYFCSISVHHNVSHTHTFHTRCDSADMLWLAVYVCVLCLFVTFCD